MGAITTERVGARLYVLGDTYAVRDRLRSAGCHWDGERRQWWIGAVKAPALAPIIAGAAAGESRPASSAALSAAGLEREAAEAFEAEARGDGRGPRTPEDPRSVRLTGKGEYKGRTYYVGASTRDGARCRLLTLPDASGKYLDFWADAGQVRVLKTYQPREANYGYGRHRRTEHTTLGSVAAFVRRQADPATRRGQCTECGHWGPSGEPCAECGGEGSHV